ncbi:glycoside hydrolase family 5 protein [Durotheca rogersii]|uniref:glycoside hydrolase family 5 protein n=1 Tax=Durotheca rogersii TaxID=419775 RepID=UPI00222015C3|nr:glycoside hydrolase family 5 protein [Durotheca rogersii]KAI5859837.1 glycoside hydrolase family 5 protein [Durotheca rogersii]
MAKPALRHLISLLTLSGSLFSSVSWASASAVSSHGRAEGWPYGPLVTAGRDIKNARGETVVYAGANWPGHGEAMIPDGLQYQSIESVVSKIKSVGMNAIRLTFAIQMIDEIFANGGKDITVKDSFVKALGQTNGTKVYSQFLAKNPAFNDSTTRLQVFDAVAAESAKQNIYVHLDNHMSRAAWCCSTTDGNSWFGDSDFNVDNWTRGLSYMANHGKSWSALTSASLRNELRRPDNNATLRSESYNWRDWYTNVRKGAAAVNSANPDLLIFLSGLDFDTYVTPVVQGTVLTPGSGRYSAADFEGYADKLVLEIHNYQNSASSCSGVKSSLYSSGFQALHAEDANTVNVFPVLLTEFGFAQTATEWQRPYATCIAEYLAEQKAGWFIWVVAGSYYIRSGTQDFEEPWGLLNHDWSDWRAPSYIEGGLKPLAKNTAQG